MKTLHNKNCVCNKEIVLPLGLRKMSREQLMKRHWWYAQGFCSQKCLVEYVCGHSFIN
jgi:hypothetical protein